MEHSRGPTEANMSVIGKQVSNTAKELILRLMAKSLLDSGSMESRWPIAVPKSREVRLNRVTKSEKMGSRILAMAKWSKHEDRSNLE